jgi:hypothetical protein
LWMFFSLRHFACSGCVARNPVLHPKHHVFQAVVQFLRLLVGVDRPVMSDFSKYGPPAERESNSFIQAKVLHRTNAVMELVLLLILVEMGEIEVGIPGGLTIGEEMGHISAGKGAHRIYVRRMEVHQPAKILATSPCSEISAAGMIALWGELLEQGIDHQKARSANDTNDFPRLHRRQHDREVIHIEGSEFTPFLLRMSHLC